MVYVVWKLGWWHFEPYSLYLFHKKTFFAFLAFQKWKMIFSNIKVGNFLWHNCLTWEDAPIYKIWAHNLKNDIDMVLPLVIWIESHECSYMIGHVVKQVFKKVVKFQVYHFSRRPVHIRRRPAKELHFFEFFIILFDFFQNRVKFVGLTIRRKKFNKSKLSLVLR